MASRASSASAAFPNRERQRLETRDRVFAAALSEFRRVGVAAAQIEDIVRAAGVARGTFYLHFPTKDHVLMELMRRKQGALAASLAASRGLSSPAAFLRRAVDLVVEDAKHEDPALWHELSAVITRHAGEMRSEATALVGVLTGFLEDAQDRHEVRSDLTPFELTAVFFPAVYGLLQMKLDAPRAELRAALYRVVDVFVRGTKP